MDGRGSARSEAVQRSGPGRPSSSAASVASHSVTTPRFLHRDEEKDNEIISRLSQGTSHPPRAQRLHPDPEDTGPVILKRTARIFQFLSSLFSKLPFVKRIQAALAQRRRLQKLRQKRLEEAEFALHSISASNADDDVPLLSQQSFLEEAEQEAAPSVPMNKIVPVSLTPLRMTQVVAQASLRAHSLPSLNDAEELNLSYQRFGVDSIRRDRMTETLQSLQKCIKLSLTDNLLSDLSGITLKSVEVLFLCRNEFSSFSQLPTCPNCHTLNLTECCITSVDGLRKRFPKLRALILRRNPIEEVPNYRKLLKQNCPSTLQLLDDGPL